MNEDLILGCPTLKITSKNDLLSKGIALILIGLWRIYRNVNNGKKLEYEEMLLREARRKYGDTTVQIFGARSSG